ncbi:S8 family peptidase [Cytobacillus firmus]|uniref:S8 family peptidase n=1 Tax=Cytobacillus firmus TaxID=1399 RepID=UPI0018CF3C98|nr:S8 family peptidase [Cytobacillus firmus]MBG9577400.1 serine protease [Cytobacillus firmus]
MFGFSMIQMVRTHADKLDLQLRQDLIHLYTPFKWTPCFLHSPLEKVLKRTKSFPVVVEFKKGCSFTDAVEECHAVSQRHFKAKVNRSFSSISCCSMDMTPAALDDLLTSCSHIHKIHYDRSVQALLDVATPSVEAGEALRESNLLTGQDVTIAVIDTGVYPHQDIGDRLKHFKDFINNRTTAYDDNGHGTHCAGDAAGDGTGSGGIYRGPAPNANIIGVKVLDKLGSGSLSTVMAGVQWCIEYNRAPENQPKIDIISMSLGSSPVGDPEDDMMVKAVNAAWDAGIVVCAAAGNSGPNFGTIASPGISEKVITAGAMDDRNTSVREGDIIANFSSRGTLSSQLIKPDVVAPGVNIISLRSPNSYLDKLQKSARVGTEYFSLSGTSMATPICARVAALILESNRQLSPDQVKNKLMTGAETWGNPQTENNKYIYGAGYISAKNSILETNNH